MTCFMMIFMERVSLEQIVRWAHPETLFALATSWTIVYCSLMHMNLTSLLRHTDSCWLDSLHSSRKFQSSQHHFSWLFGRLYNSVVIISAGCYGDDSFSNFKCGSHAFISRKCSNFHQITTFTQIWEIIYTWQKP